MTVPVQFSTWSEICPGDPSHEVIALANGYARSGVMDVRVVDLGCGNGRNTLLLAAKGCSVTAVDTSTDSIARTKRLASEFDLRIEAVVENVGTFHLNGECDAILAHGILHFLEPSAVASVISRIQDATKPGGYNVYTIAPFKNLDLVIHDLKVAGHKNSVAARELLRFYDGWELVSREQYHKWDSHPGIGVHDHPIEKTVFRKPNGSDKGIIRAVELQMVRPKAQVERWTSVDLRRLISKTKEDVLTASGHPDCVLPYHAEVPRLTKCGFVLELLIYGRTVIYVANGIVSGVSVFATNIFRFEPSSQSDTKL